MAESQLGEIARARGDLSRASGHHRGMLSVALRAGSSQLQAAGLLKLAATAIDEGNLDEVDRLDEEISGLLARGSKATALRELDDVRAAAARCRGNHQRALRIVTETIARLRAGGSMSFLPRQLFGAGRLLVDLGRRDEALPHLLEAETLAREGSDWQTGVLPQAYLALAGERDPRSVAVSENAPVSARAEAHLVLHRAGAGGDHLARARALCEHLSRHLSGDALDRFWRWNPTARGILEQERLAERPQG